MSEIGTFLKELRGSRSLREVEKLSGVSHTYLSSLEKGADPRTGKERKPTVETLKKLAKAYDHPYEELLAKAGYINDWKDLDSKINVKKLANEVQLFEQAIENYQNNITTPIYLNEENEGNFYFFNDSGPIDDDLQQKIKEIIKTLLG